MLLKLWQKTKVERIETLKYDPRPSYHNDSERIYGMSYGEWQIKFKVDKSKLNNIYVTPLQKKNDTLYREIENKT